MSGKIIRILVMVAVVLLGSVVPSLASAVDGPRRSSGWLSGNSYRTYTVWFRGGEEARVAVVGDSGSDVHVYVYDENGNQVGRHEEGATSCVTTWNPRWTGPFTIKVVNQGRYSSQYGIATN
jgi:hypothetical protein